MDVHDPRQEWRRLFSELYGTFLLVMVAAGAGMMGEAFPGQISRAAAVVAPGIMVMAVIMFMGKVSGAHLNPAVSMAFALRGEFPWRRVPGYVVMQLAGAAVAALILRQVINVSAVYGSNYPATAHSNGAALGMELLLTLGLVSVILGTASGAQHIGIIGAIGVGGYIDLAGHVGEPDLERVDEPGPHLRPRSHRGELDRLLGLRRWPADWGGDRRRVRVRPSRSGRRPIGLAGRTGDARPRRGTSGPGPTPAQHPECAIAAVEHDA